MTDLWIGVGGMVGMVVVLSTLLCASDYDEPYMITLRGKGNALIRKWKARWMDYWRRVAAEVRAQHPAHPDYRRKGRS